MYLYNGARDSLLRIHGTTQPWLVETATSSGCVRMINAHVEDLYERVEKGTPVFLR
ncbi:MAG: L,D-transpeptidase [Sulfitobacter geojensis]